MTSTAGGQAQGLGSSGQAATSGQVAGTATTSTASGNNANNAAVGRGSGGYANACGNNCAGYRDGRNYDRYGGWAPQIASPLLHHSLDLNLTPFVPAWAAAPHALLQGTAAALWL